MIPLNTREKVDILRRVALFGRIPSHEIDVLAPMMETEYYEAGELVCERGTHADCVYVVVSGALSVHLPNLEEAIRTEGPGSVLGEMGLFSAGRRTATIRAEEASTVLTLDYVPFRTFLEKFPNATFGMIEIMVRRFLETTERLTS